jgi:hypothetical protein
LVLTPGVRITAQVAGQVVVDAESEGSAVEAVNIDSSTHVTGLVFRNGSAVQGGGLYSLASSVSFTDCVFEANTAVLGGGAYLRDGSRSVFTRCTFTGNTATVGGGIYLDYSPVTLSSCTLVGNEASDGSALSANNAAEAVVTTTSIFVNVAREGVTLSSNDSSPSYTSCTVVLNSGGDGVFGLRGSASRIDHCIVAFNATDAVHCAGTSSPAIGCNVVFGNTSNALCAGDLGTNLFVNPLFCGPGSFDFRLAANSPAAIGACGEVGAFDVGCPAQGVETAVRSTTWSAVKRVYR